MSTFLDTVRSTVRRHQMLSHGDTVVVAVSGGADSMALLHALIELRAEFSLSLHVAHFDHRLRPDSDIDAAFVQNAAAALLALPLTLGMGDVRGRAAAERRSMEDAARAARYEFFAEVCAAVGAAALATAHTRDDQIETVLMRVLDRAPWETLAGIPPIRPLMLNPRAAVKVIRPLIDISRHEVTAFLGERHLQWRDDPTNEDLSIRRNWIRHAVIPPLAAVVPSVRDILVEVGATIREIDAVLTAAAGRIFERTRRSDGHSVSVPLAVVAPAPRAVQRRILREAVGAVAGTDAGISRVVEDEALTLLVRRRPGEVRAGSWVIRRSYDALSVGPAPLPPPDEIYELRVPGEVVARGFGVRVSAEYVDDAAANAAGPAETVMDADVTGSLLRVRPVRPGDRIRPLGMRGEKKVQDLFVDGKVPRWERSRIPVIVDEQDRVLWVVGQRVSEDARVTTETKRAVRLRVVPVGPTGPRLR